MSILLYGCTTWTLTKRTEKKLDGNYTIMLRTVLKTSRTQRPANQRLYNHLPSISKTNQIRHCWRSKDGLIRDILVVTPSHGQSGVGQQAKIYRQQLCTDTGCNLETLWEAMVDRDEWQMRVREIHTSDTAWWWWWWLLNMINLRIFVCLLVFLVDWLSLIPCESV